MGSRGGGRGRVGTWRPEVHRGVWGARGEGRGRRLRPVPEDAMAKLYISEGGKEAVYELFDDSPEVTVGRGASNAVQIADGHASKVHLVLRRVRGRWKLVDLESKNGTRVNGAYKNAHWLSQND